MTPAEQSVLAALIGSSGGCLHEISLKPTDYSTPAGEALHRLIQDTVEAGLPADPVTLGNALMGEDDATKRLLDPATIWQISSVYVPAGAVEHHAGIVAQDAARRNLINLASTINQKANSGADIGGLVEEAETALSNLTAGIGSTTRAITDNIDATIEDLDKPATYIETPWENLNEVINGWKKGGLYIIGARPSSGKTVVGFQAALNLCNLGPVAYTSLEMSEDELHLRMIAQDARVDMGRINRHQLSNDDLARVVGARKRWGHLPLYVDPSNDATLAQVARHAWSVKRKHGLKALVVDYIGLIEGRPGQKEYEVVTESARKLKLLAKALDVPVIALSQLNRDSEGRENKKPQMSDLRSSGALEQDADVVVLLHRDLTETPHELEMIIAKNRQGICRSAHFDFVGHHSYVRDA